MGAQNKLFHRLFWLIDTIYSAKRIKIADSHDCVEAHPGKLIRQFRGVPKLQQIFLYKKETREGLLGSPK